MFKEVYIYNEESNEYIVESITMLDPEIFRWFALWDTSGRPQSMIIRTRMEHIYCLPSIILRLYNDEKDVDCGLEHQHPFSGIEIAMASMVQGCCSLEMRKGGGCLHLFLCSVFGKPIRCLTAR